VPKGIFVRTPEHIENIRRALHAALFGKKLSPEHRARISAAKKGNKNRLGIPHTQELRERFAKKYKARTDAERFWSKVQKSPDPNGCWIWTAHLQPNGYGTFHIGSRLDKKRRVVRAHRFAYELTNGPIAEGMDICHSCDNRYPPGDVSYRRCVRPDHLFQDTRKANSDDMFSKNRQHHFDRRGQMSWSSKLTPDRVIEMRQLRRTSGVSYAQLGKIYGVTDANARRTVLGITWSHIREGLD
jgi:hypothetical protein